MNAKLVQWSALAGFFLAACAGSAFGEDVPLSPVKSDETVTFYTTAAWPAQEAGKWEVDVHGIIFEEESRPQVAAGLSRALGFELEKLTPDEKKILDARLKFFISDNERDKEIPVTLGGVRFQLPKSAANGHFRTTLTITAPPSGPVPVCAVLQNGDERCFAGAVLPMADTDAPMVVSDIDDTIKITEIRNRRATIANTFSKPFADVPGMAAAYQRWAADDGAVFHYVSGSPWQLYTPLEEFVREKKFPAGAWHLKHLRIADPETIVAFLGSQHEHKLNCIRPLVERWQKRRFVLVGDTGEQDPEIYAALAREHPKRIERIFIRNVSQETRDNTRMTAAFKDVPAEKWTLFDKADELPAKLRP